MIKKLRTKFVCIMMAIVMVMVAGILGVVIHFTALSMEVQSVNMMRRTAAIYMQKGYTGKQPKGEVRLPFFVVQINTRGEMFTLGGDYFDLSDQEHIQKIANSALSSDTETGKLAEYDLRYLKTNSRHGVTIIFTDTTTENATLKNLFYSSLLIFLVTVVVFLGISILLSQWAIKPVATAWEQQRQFVADASHELKTPLAVIMANAELLQNDDGSDAERRKFSNNILAMSYQMRTLVENMLEMARVDNGTLHVKFEQVDFSQLVNDAVLSFQLLYKEKGLTLQCNVQDEIFLQGSEQRLFQVLDVLLDNGLKYTAPHGRVAVNLSSAGKNCLLSVAGPGETIAKDDLRNIFKRFYRTDKARAINGSYGLGLAIAESIVLAHKGKIWAQSENGINTFFVQLPVHTHPRKS